MQIKKRLLDFWKALLLQMRRLQGYGRNNIGNPGLSRQEDTELETEYRRRITGRSVESFVNNLWDAPHVRKGVEKLLRQPSREEKAESIREREETAHARSLRLSRLGKHEGWRIDVVSLLRQWEAFSYMNLRFPENRRTNVSPDYYNGFQNGAIWVIEGLRNEIVKADISLQKKNEAVKQQKKS